MVELLAYRRPDGPDLSALGGALVGGGGHWCRDLQDRRQTADVRARPANIEREREDKERRAITRGAARVMRTRYHRLASIIETSLRNGVWLPTGVEIEVAPSIDDRKLVAALASPDEWLDIDVAEFSLGLMLAGRDSALAERGQPVSLGGYIAGLPVVDPEPQNIARTIAALSKAKDALGRIAEIGDGEPGATEG